jgi:uncharacterized protein YlzI (FlbEa/FlbD family)
MIKLTRSNDRDVWVEPSAIVMVEENVNRTTITLVSGTMFDVKEGVQHVLAERLKATQLFVDADGIDETTLTVMPGRFVTNGRSGFVK